MDYKTKIVVGGLAILVGIMARCFAPTPTINGADILGFIGCWLLWRGLISEWPKPAPPTEGKEEEAAVDETAKSASILEERRRSFLRLFEEE